MDASDYRMNTFRASTGGASLIEFKPYQNPSNKPGNMLSDPLPPDHYSQEDYYNRLLDQDNEFKGIPRRSPFLNLYFRTYKGNQGEV